MNKKYSDELRNEAIRLFKTGEPSEQQFDIFAHTTTLVMLTPCKIEEQFNASHK